MGKSPYLGREGAEDLGGMKVAQAAVQIQPEITGGIIFQPFSLGGFKIHLSEGRSLAQAPLQDLIPSFFRSVSKTYGQMDPSPTSC